MLIHSGLITSVTPTEIATILKKTSIDLPINILPEQGLEGNRY